MMVKRASIRFIEASEAVVEPVTKFGGQPAWLAAPAWPLSRSTGQPMRFIGQISLRDWPLRPAGNRLAYLFITDEEGYVEGTWEPDGGENAVIVQSGDASTAAASPPGPTLYRMVAKPDHDRLVAEPCEFTVELTASEDPELWSEDQLAESADEEIAAYSSALEGNKLGGTPMFVQAQEFPDERTWELLLQLDSTSVPFYVNFGDAGVGYAFITQDGSEGKFLWQCT